MGKRGDIMRGTGGTKMFPVRNEGTYPPLTREPDMKEPVCNEGQALWGA
jgi:hypothetical protein